MNAWHLVALVAVGLAVSSPAHAQRERAMGGVGITVYQDSNFGGRNATFRDDVADLRQSGMNDRIESLEVAPGEMWEVCVDAYYRGRCQVFSEYEPDLRRRGWARQISSMRRVRGGGGYPGPGPVYPPQPPVFPPGGGSNGLVLYENRNFRGSSRTLNGPTRDLRALGFNDKAESLRLPRGEVWEICRDIDFRDCRQVNGDLSDLRGLGLRGEVSSARPYGGGWGGGNGGWNPGGRPPVQAGRLVLYTGANFTGRSYTVQGGENVIRLGRVQSVVVQGGNWELCEDENFRGRCTTVNVNVPDIRALGLPGRVGSARLVAQPW